MTLILTILAFGLMVFVHELGHFLAAKWSGVGIEKFSLGFGKAIWSVKRKGIEYRVGWIPLGGYVKMKGENPDDTVQDEKGSFRAISWWKKVIIALSGPFANLLFGMLLFIISYMLPMNIEDQRPVISKAEGKWSAVFTPGDSLVSFNGKRITGFSDFLEKLITDKQGILVLANNAQQRKLTVSPGEAESLAVSLSPASGTRIGEVIPKTPAYHARLLPGDLIVAVDSLPVSDWYVMRKIIIDSPKDTVLLTVRRGNKTFSKELRLESSMTTGAQKAIGIIQDQPVKYQRQFTFAQSLKMGTYSTINFITLNYQALGRLLQKPEELKRSVGGPVMIASMSQQIGSKGFGYLLLFFASISLMLMIMNLLPIPILDGGLILFALIEAVIRRPIPLRIQSLLQTIGFFLLMALMVFAFYSDISSEFLRFLNR
jgi:regulator of sigma E protease